MADAPREYPKRAQFFANRFIRVLAKACVANHLGPEGFTLLAVVAMTEDAKGYREPVTFFNEQLMPLVGAKSVKTMDRVRSRAVAAGWLVYTPGGKGKAGRYWVDIPTAHRGWDDAPSDEPAEADPRDSADYSWSKSTQKPPEKCQRSAREVPEKCQRKGEHSSYTKDNLSQESVGAKPPTPAPGNPVPKKPRARDPLFDALAEVTHSDPVVTGPHVGKLAALLRKADPPYTPDEVFEFARRYHELCGYAPGLDRDYPSLGEIQKNIKKVRPARPRLHVPDPGDRFASLNAARRLTDDSSFPGLARQLNHEGDGDEKPTGTT